MPYFDWRGHGAFCSCESCDFHRIRDGATAFILILVCAGSLIYYAWSRWS